MPASNPTTDNFDKPESITGGCLCGSIRYKVEFPKDHDFLESSMSCQCTQCRRSTGSLLWFAHGVPLNNFTYTSAVSTLKNYNATKGIQRGFCTNCGSFLYWRDESLENIDISVGSVDPEYLVGEKDKNVGYGFALANCSGSNVYCENEIKGVTEGWIGKTGKRWAKGSKDGVQV